MLIQISTLNERSRNLLAQVFMKIGKQSGEPMTVVDKDVPNKPGHFILLNAEQVQVNYTAGHIIAIRLGPDDIGPPQIQEIVTTILQKFAEAKLTEAPKGFNVKGDMPPPETKWEDEDAD